MANSIDAQSVTDRGLQSLAYVISFHPNTLREEILCYPHFSDEETEA